jgi:hypothetical protein
MHVVVTGQARHVGCYRTLLHRLQSARRADALQSVTLVHWRSQADLVQGLLQQLPEAADRLLLLDEPVIRSPGHFFHQAYSLERGLDGLPDDGVALRLRPDIYISEAFLPGIAAAMAALDKPLWSPFADLTCPFFACDMVFGGRVSALRAQTNYSTRPYLVLAPLDFAREPARVYSHEPEVQRWLHPARAQDWRTEAYWPLFPSFGLVTANRRALMSQFAGWDFYQAIRKAWLEYVVQNVALGGLQPVGRLGLVRIDGPAATRGRVQWLDVLNEADDIASERTLERESHEFVWTTDAAQVANFLAFVAERNLPERRLTPVEAHQELVEKWRSARAILEQKRLPNGLRMPYRSSAIAY